LYVDGAKTASEVSNTLHVIDASNTADVIVSQSLPQETKVVTDDSRLCEVSSVKEQFDKAAADVEDDIVENSSPIRRAMDDSFVVPMTTDAAATTLDNAPVPPALLSLPSLMHLSRKALDLRAKRLKLSAEDQSLPKNREPLIADMFSEDDEQSCSLAETTKVISSYDVQYVRLSVSIIFCVCVLAPVIWVECCMNCVPDFFSSNFQGHIEATLSVEWQSGQL